MCLGESVYKDDIQTDTILVRKIKIKDGFSDNLIVIAMTSEIKMDR